MRKRWMIGMLLAGALAISACGVNTSGEPAIIDEVQILPTATRPASPTPAQSPTPASGSDNATPESVDAAASADAPAPDRTLGRELFLATCLPCHGSEDGVGPSLFTTIADADKRVEGLDKAAYIRQSILEPGAYVLDGYQNIMPSYEGDFTDHELNSIVAFIAEAAGRPTTDAINPTPAAGGATPVASAQDGALSVRGRVVPGTRDAEAVAEGIDVELLVLDSAGQFAGQYNVATTEGGAYLFENVMRAPGNIYLIRVNYAGVPQGVQISAIEGTETQLTQDVTVYERTSDRTSIQVRWAQMLINFAPINEFGLEVWLSLELVNNGDQIVTTEEVAETGWLVSVPVELPPGAFGIQPMQTEGSLRYQVDLVDGIPVVKDTWPLRPGQVHSITIAYYLPYVDQAVIDTALDFPVIDGVVLVPNDTVGFESEQFDKDGQFLYRVTTGGFHISELEPGETIDPERDFTLIKAHNLTSAIAAGDRLSFTLTGKPTRTINVISPSPEPPGASSDDGSDTNLLPVALFVLGISVLVLAGVLWWRQRALLAAPAPATGTVTVPAGDDWAPPRASEGKEALLAAMVALDDARAAGTLDDETYEERRRVLTARLLPLLEDEGS